MKRLFITTTNAIENGQITDYCGIVSSHIVAGTGFITDIAAGFRDFFGGRSSAYRSQLESLYNEALDELSLKATQIGANCVVGLKMDIDNISGKGMSMFMISAVGTAAIATFDHKEFLQPSQTDISSEKLFAEVKKRGLLKKLANGNVLYQTEWETILSNPSEDYVDYLTRIYFSESGYSDGFVDFYHNYASLIDRKALIASVYKHMEEFKKGAPLIKKLQLFDAPSICQLIEHGHLHLAITLLTAEQPSYNTSDLNAMKQLLSVLDNLPDTGKIEYIKGSMFSKEGEKYICANGHKNNTDRMYCDTCGITIKGLTSEEVKAVEQYRTHVEALSDLLEHS